MICGKSSFADCQYLITSTIFRGKEKLLCTFPYFLFNIQYYQHCYRWYCDIMSREMFLKTIVTLQGNLHSKVILGNTGIGTLFLQETANVSSLLLSFTCFHRFYVLYRLQLKKQLLLHLVYVKETTATMCNLQSNIRPLNSSNKSLDMEIRYFWFKTCFWDLKSSDKELKRIDFWNRVDLFGMKLSSFRFMLCGVTPSYITGSLLNWISDKTCSVFYTNADGIPLSIKQAASILFTCKIRVFLVKCIETCLSVVSQQWKSTIETVTLK